MLIINICPKSEDSFVQMIQALNDKKFRYFADLSKNQIVNFENERSVIFFRTVRTYCDILAIMNENFQDYPFVDYGMNNLFTKIVSDLVALESTEPAKARLILETFKEVFKTITSSSVPTTTTESSEALATVQAETTSLAKTDETQTEKVHVEVEETQAEENEKPNILDAIPVDVRNSMGENELALYPYVYKGIATANNLTKADRTEKAKAFLDTINFPNDAYIIKMFLALEGISTISYQNILASKPFDGKRILTNNEIHNQIRNAFRDWANKHCATVLKNNRLTSFIDILKIYKKFVE